MKLIDWIMDKQISFLNSIKAMIRKTLRKESNLKVISKILKLGNKSLDDVEEIVLIYCLLNIRLDNKTIDNIIPYFYLKEDEDFLEALKWIKKNDLVIKNYSPVNQKNLREEELNINNYLVNDLIWYFKDDERLVLFLKKILREEIEKLDKEGNKNGCIV